MPIQVDRPKTSKAAPAVVLAVLVLMGVVIATNWQAFILLIVLLAAGAGWWVAQ